MIPSVCSQSAHVVIFRKIACPRVHVHDSMIPSMFSQHAHVVIFRKIACPRVHVQDSIRCSYLAAMPCLTWWAGLACGVYSHRFCTAVWVQCASAWYGFEGEWVCVWERANLLEDLFYYENPNKGMSQVWEFMDHLCGYLTLKALWTGYLENTFIEDDSEESDSELLYSRMIPSSQC